MRPAGDFGHLNRAAQGFGQLRLQQTRHRIGTAERLETAKAKAAALVLEIDIGYADGLRQRRQRHQRSFGIAWPTRDGIAGGGQARRTEDCILRGGPGGGLGRQRIQAQRKGFGCAFEAGDLARHRVLRWSCRWQENPRRPRRPGRESKVLLRLFDRGEHEVEHRDLFGAMAFLDQRARRAAPLRRTWPVSRARWPSCPAWPPMPTAPCQTLRSPGASSGQDRWPGRSPRYRFGQTWCGKFRTAAAAPQSWKASNRSCNLRIRFRRSDTASPRCAMMSSSNSPVAQENGAWLSQNSRESVRSGSTISV